MVLISSNCYNLLSALTVYITKKMCYFNAQCGEFSLTWLHVKVIFLHLLFTHNNSFLRLMEELNTNTENSIWAIIIHALLCYCFCK